MSSKNDSSVAVHDHLRPIGENYPAGIYRVVGTGDPVVLLRVTDERDRRRATGELLSISSDLLSGFEPAPDPDTGVRPLAWTRGLLSWMYWAVRSLLG